MVWAQKKKEETSVCGKAWLDFPKISTLVDTKKLLKKKNSFFTFNTSHAIFIENHYA